MASRLRDAARVGLVGVLDLLVAFFLPGCGLYKEFVRRGQVLDSLAVRLERVERKQADQGEELARFRADLLTETENLGTKIDQVDASVEDLGARLERISRKLGIGYGDLTPPAKESTSAPQETAGVGIDADRLYNTAYFDFNRGKFQVAIAGFRQFLARFPESDNADNAQYWIGECYYSQGDLASAEREFRLVLERYPEGNKVPAAAYKLGLVFLAQNRVAEARQQLQDVVNRYPGTTEAKMALERLKSLE
ncbi:MAG: tol-pal system protein YbgF [candidate division WOR-3 bacterium]